MNFVHIFFFTRRLYDSMQRLLIQFGYVSLQFFPSVLLTSFIFLAKRLLFYHSFRTVQCTVGERLYTTT